MLFSKVLGLPHIKNHLLTTTEKGRVPHAQLFTGSCGSGILPMALAYARLLLCSHKADYDSCNLKLDHFSHPDLHFSFPVASNDRVKKNPVSDNFMEEWRQMLMEKPYSSLFDWYLRIGIENKQGQIGVNEAQDIVKKLALKSYEGGYKILIMWMADKMNTSCANKLLKLIEEPPEKTIFLLLTEDEEGMLDTIKSRCQVLHFPPLAEKDIVDGLLQKSTNDPAIAQSTAKLANGDFTRALALSEESSNDSVFENWFVTWVRSAFKAKSNKTSVAELISWSETIAATGRESQKKFLLYCLEFFRQALFYNYNAKDLVFLNPKVAGFSLEKFAPFVHHNNISAIRKELEDAVYHIERNANPKIVFCDLSLKLTRLLHQKK